MSEIVLAKAEFGLEECVVGEPYILRGTATAVDDEQVTIAVESAEHDEEVETEEEPIESGPAVKTSPVAKIGMPSRKAYA